MPLDLNSNFSSILDTVSIPVTKAYILKSDKVTIFSWDAENPHYPGKMDISIEDGRICHDIINGPNSRNFVRDRQMCGIPLMFGQRITAVIESISLTF